MSGSLMDPAGCQAWVPILALGSPSIRSCASRSAAGHSKHGCQQKGHTFFCNSQEAAEFARTGPALAFWGETGDWKMCSSSGGIETPAGVNTCQLKEAGNREVNRKLESWHRPKQNQSETKSWAFFTGHLIGHHLGSFLPDKA